ncbi:MAG: EAL domain-containing protein [Actinomycetota bacterium]|nr:EAL domain-containing protein [Actinomycetota bacterium]
MTTASGARQETGPILIVDDDPVLQSLFTRVLEMAGFRALVAGDGESALALLRQEPVAVVLLDGHLPGMTGAQVVRLIRADPETELVPVVMVTGASDVAARVEGLEAGADDYVVKPVDIEELVARVKAQVRSRLRSRAALGAAAEHNLRQRIEAVQALARIRSDGPHEVVAEAISGALTRVEGLRAARLYHLPARGIAVTLAGFGSSRSGVEPGRPVPQRLARQLHQRTGRGPSIVERANRDGGVVVALVPFGPTDQTVGALEVELETTGDDDLAGYLALSTAVDLAGMVTALLCPLLADSAERAGSIERIDKLIASDAIWTVFQPIVELDGRRIVGHEALSRVRDGTPPDSLLTEAAVAGVSDRVELAMVAKAVLATRQFPAPTWLSFNVSPGLVIAEPERLADALQPAMRPVVLELTEHEPIQDYDQLRAALALLPDSVSVAVDDAGAGYASLRHVLQLGPALVKLDREWVGNIHNDPARQALVGGLSSFATETGCELVAEGVETPSELDALVRVGIRLGQGFLLGRPERPG